MEKSGYKICLSFYMLFLYASCAKTNSNDTKKTCTGDNTGNVTIIASPTHHGAYAQALTAYIKFNAQDYPGNHSSDYDLVVNGDPMTNKFYFKDMNCGKYYVYATAIDTLTLDTLRGGFPIEPTISEGQFDIIIHVSE